MLIIKYIEEILLKYFGDVKVKKDIDYPISTFEISYGFFIYTITVNETNYEFNVNLKTFITYGNPIHLSNKKYSLCKENIYIVVSEIYQNFSDMKEDLRILPCINT